MLVPKLAAVPGVVGTGPHYTCCFKGCNIEATNHDGEEGKARCGTCRNTCELNLRPIWCAEHLDHKYHRKGTFHARPEFQ